jgi:hypothetical protein
VRHGRLLARGFAATALLAGLLTGCGGGSGATPSGHNVQPIVPQVGLGVDAQTTVRAFPKSHFELLVANTSGLGYIDSFTWSPPPGAPIKAVIGSSAGHCRLLGQKISCALVELKPPSCTCKGDGGIVAVSFVTDDRADSSVRMLGYGQGGLVISSVTPVLYFIPSTPGQKPASEVPLCRKGQQSTKETACVSQS